MKRVLALILVLILSLVACDGIDNSKRCWNCNKTVSISAKFCEHCGSDISLGSNTTSSNFTFEDYVNSKYPSSVPNNSQQNKTTCLFVGCDNIPSGIGLYCSEHTCVKKSCTLGKDYSSNFCSIHKCDSVGCDNGQNDSGYYCSEHACAHKGCISEKTYSSNFCNRHKCNSIGCENGQNEAGYYCSEHACADKGCTRERTYSSNYCSWHKCDEVGCKNRKKDYGSYCSEHKCAVSWCSSSKSPFSDYCYIHDD